MQDLDAPVLNQEVKVASCPNCSTEINGPFCRVCGQEQKNLNRYIWTLAGELADDISHLDSRVSKTFFALLFRPAYLTKEYFSGRRERYVPPIRLYLVISFLFFFILPIIGDTNNNAIDIQSDDTTDPTAWQQELRDGVAQISISDLSEEENKQLSETLQKQINKVIVRIEEDPASLFGEFMDLASAVMFFLLPIFAIFLKLFYLGSGVYYAEHLLLALHNHCFLFIALLLISLLQLGAATNLVVVTVPIGTAIQIWVPIYMFLSLKFAYGQSTFITFLKFSCYQSPIGYLRYLVSWQ